jgi:hypothetical protein
MAPILQMGQTKQMSPTQQIIKLTGQEQIVQIVQQMERILQTIQHKIVHIRIIQIRLSQMQQIRRIVLIQVIIRTQHLTTQMLIRLMLQGRIIQTIQVNKIQQIAQILLLIKQIRIQPTVRLITRMVQTLHLRIKPILILPIIKRTRPT